MATDYEGIVRDARAAAGTAPPHVRQGLEDFAVVHDPQRPHRIVADWAEMRAVPIVDLFYPVAANPDAAALFLATDRHFNADG